MLINGKIEGIVYRNEDNGYTVARVLMNGEILTCVGKFPTANIGERVEIEGTLKKNEKYGEQVVVDSIKVLPPNDLAGIIKYLSSGLIKGIGEVTATNIVGQFGKDTLEVIEFAPMRLAEVRGISKEKAIKIATEYKNLN